MLTLHKFFLIIYDSIIIQKRYCTVEYANYPTLGELLRQDIFSNSQVLSGEAALDIPVAGVNLTDTPDYYDWGSPMNCWLQTATPSAVMHPLCPHSLDTLRKRGWRVHVSSPHGFWEQFQNT